MGHHDGGGGMGGGMGGMGGGMGGMGGQPTVIENNYYGSNPQVQQGTQARAGCLLFSAPLNLAGREALHPSRLANDGIDSHDGRQCGRTMVAGAAALVAAMPSVPTLEIQGMVEEHRGTLVAGRTWAEGEARTTEAAETTGAGGTLEEAAATTTEEAAGETMEETAVRAFSPSSRLLMPMHRQMHMLPVAP